MEMWICPCGTETNSVEHTRVEPPVCRWCGHVMFAEPATLSVSAESWAVQRRDREGHRDRLIAEVRELVDEAQIDPIRVAAGLHARIDGLERRTLDPLAAVEAAIATMREDELEALNQRLEAVGLRMVERAAALRARLKG